MREGYSELSSVLAVYYVTLHRHNKQGAVRTVSELAIKLFQKLSCHQGRHWAVGVVNAEQANLAKLLS